MAAPTPPANNQLPPVSFATFLVSLGHTAMEQLHAEGEPHTVQMARQTIDLIGVLKEKTSGNLDDEETQLMDHLLGDLEKRYVQASKA
jgi:hypothetical protein